jgi:excisionase family DNA binding protein
MGSLYEMLASLDQALEKIPVECLPAVMTKLAAMQSVLAARMLNGAVMQKDSGVVDDTHNLLNIPQVAERLAIPTGRAYELARQGKIPIVKVGKYVRVEPEALIAWIAEHRENKVDERLYSVYSTRKHERKGTPKVARAARLDSIRSGRQDGGHGQHHRAVGTRGDSDSRVDGSVNRAPGS